MRAADLMSRSVRSCHVEDRCDVAARHMWDGDCGCVVVTRTDGTVAGIVTDRDLCMASWTTGKSLGEIPVRGVMASPARAVLASDPLDSVLETFGKEQVNRVPVVDPRGVLVGLLSIADVVRLHAELKAIPAESVLKTIAAIRRPRRAATLALPAPASKVGEPTVSITPQALAVPSASSAAVAPSSSQGAAQKPAPGAAPATPSTASPTASSNKGKARKNGGRR